MKIVNIILTSQNGGAEQVFIDYLTVFKNLGHQVLAITKADAPYADKVETLGIKVKKITNKFGYHDFFAVQKIQKIIQEFDADIVIAHAGRAMVLARKAIEKVPNKKIFFIAVNHSMNVKRSVGADLIFSVNREIFYRTIHCGQDEDKSFVIPNAVDLTDMLHDSAPVNFQEKEVITIGVMARLDKAKGFCFAIKAIKKLKDLECEKKWNKKFILKIAGSGPQEQFLRSLTKELNVEDKVEFLGWVKSKKEFFDSIDIFCLASQNETFGLVLLEAMKFRKPIISTDADGPKEILRHEVDALMVGIEPLYDVENRIAEAAMRMVNEADLVNQMIENASTKLKEKYSYTALEKVMKEIVGKG